MKNNNKKRLVILCAWGILLTETVFIVVHYQEVEEFLIHYGWVAPIFLFKSFIKKFLLLNVFGVLKVFWGLFWHLFKLLLIKLLKTFGVRYGTYFSSRRWSKMSQRLRIFGKRLGRKQRGLQRFMLSFRKREYTLIIVAFFPFFLLLFLFGIAFKMTREAMVKTSSEIGVTKVAYSTAHKNPGLIGRLKRIDAWILKRIEQLSERK